MTSSSAAADDDSRSRNPRSTSAHGSEGEPEERQLPNYATSGALLGDKLYKGVSLQYAEPDDSRKPDKSYRFYVFKAGEIVDTVRLDQQSVYLLGRDRTIVDLPLDHPSISKQQAVIQFRLVVEEVGFLGETEDRVAPFVYDLGSANGTMVNGEKVKEREYVELKVKDMLTFGLSSREYLLMCEDEVEEKK
ncbi:SMAD/FHA domain-containing protein [Myxozyma melibiosi]|uniref:SMAD/FHA domain-containing protein n=1 Tax=Myxozyma melibiosi TaxID=54550 RepID=A0ABR1F568_9ASCO